MRGAERQAVIADDHPSRSGQPGRSGGAEALRGEGIALERALETAGDCRAMTPPRCSRRRYSQSTDTLVRPSRSVSATVSTEASFFAEEGTWINVPFSIRSPV
jgi:hypothetical protein